MCAPSSSTLSKNICTRRKKKQQLLCAAALHKPKCLQKSLKLYKWDITNHSQHLLSWCHPTCLRCLRNPDRITRRSLGHHNRFTHQWLVLKQFGRRARCGSWCWHFSYRHWCGRLGSRTRCNNGLCGGDRQLGGWWRLSGRRLLYIYIQQVIKIYKVKLVYSYSWQKSLGKKKNWDVTQPEDGHCHVDWVMCNCDKLH